MKNFIVSFLFLLLSIKGFSQKTEKISVYFKFNESVLENNSKSTIDSIISNSIEHIYLQGHCDSIGGNGYNDALSLKRVLEVKQYLISKNIAENTIEIRALGKRLPLNKNENEKSRALNRRVEIEIARKKIIPVAKPETIAEDTSNKIIIKDVVINKVKNHPVIGRNMQEVEITGIVLDGKDKPIIAEISLNDKNGKEILKTLNAKDGKYKFKALLNKKEDYSLVYYNDKTFTDVKTINLSKPELPFTNLISILLKLKCGEKYVLKNMNFVGDTSQLLTGSIPSMLALYKLMKENESLFIRIEGHVNYPIQGRFREYIFVWRKQNIHMHYFPLEMNRKERNQWLSNERAKMVYNYLINNGIDPKRMSYIGYGATKMLFPFAHTDEQREQNRRVEINVICFE